MGRGARTLNVWSRGGGLHASTRTWNRTSPGIPPVIVEEEEEKAEGSDALEAQADGQNLREGSHIFVLFLCCALTSGFCSV